MKCLQMNRKDAPSLQPAQYQYRDRGITLEMLLRCTICLFVVTFSLEVCEVFSQAVLVQGIVIDNNSKESLVGANVILLQYGNLVTGTTTDIEGHYNLTGDWEGSYELVVSFIGFQDKTFLLTFKGPASEKIDVSLVKGVTLNPMVITASRQQEKYLDSPASISVLDVREFEQDAVPSAAATLRNTLGVDIVQAGLDRYQIALRGFNAAFVSKTFAMVDLRQAVTPSMGDNQFSSMPISPIDLAQVEVVRGPGSALYGPGVEQGLIHFITKSPFSYPGTAVSVGVGQRQLVQGSFRHAGVVENRLGYKFVAHYSQGEDWKLDESDPIDEALIGRIAPNIGKRDYSTWKGYVLGTLQYRPRENVNITTTGGYSAIKSITLANIGEQQSDNFARMFGQFRVDAGDFFGQLYINKNNANDTYIYRSGATLIDKSSQFNGQAQYRLSLADGMEEVILGADYKHTNPVTGGTIHGRNEDDDTITEYGAYVQSETVLSSHLKLIATGRLDYNNVTEESQFSPRIGLIYKPMPEHSIRATFNRAFSTPVGVNLFVDFVIRDAGAFLFRARGAANGWTFASQPNTTSFFNVPGLDGQDPGVGILLARAYAAVTSNLVGEGGAFAEFPSELKNLLLEKTQQIQGFSDGSMAFISGSNVRPVTKLNDLPPVRQTITNTLEVGYKGVIGGKVAVGIDVYYTRKKNFLSELQLVTPFVLAPNIANDLATAVTATLSDAELSQFGLSITELAEIYRDGSAAITNGPIGLIETVENFDAGSKPEGMLTFINFGEIDFFGTDIEGQFFVNEHLTIVGNLTLVNDNFFDEDEVGDSQRGFVVAMNAPRKKAGAGFEYTTPGGFLVKASMRYIGGFEVRSGVHQGSIDSYSLLDVGIGYNFYRYTSGLRLDVMGQNILNNEHREYVGAPELGRFVMARLTYSFK